MTPAALAAKLEAKASGDGWLARCPAHEDANPSLSIATGADGRILLHCHAGCALQAIIGALGLGQRDLFADNGPTGRAIVATYDYTDEFGELLYGFAQPRQPGRDTRLLAALALLKLAIRGVSLADRVREQSPHRLLLEVIDTIVQ